MTLQVVTVVLLVIIALALVSIALTLSTWPQKVEGTRPLGSGPLPAAPPAATTEEPFVPHSRLIRLRRGVRSTGRQHPPRDEEDEG